MRWLAGEPATGRRLEPLLLDPGSAGSDLRPLRDRGGRRRLDRLRTGPDAELRVKRFRADAGGHRLRERVKRMLGLTAARREWRALSRLQRAGVPVPAPRALGVLPGGDHVLAMEFLAGQTLDRLLREDVRPRARLIDALGGLLTAFHAAGWVHGDLHHGNVLVTPRGPVLLDLQSARCTRSARARLRDLGELDRSLAGALSLVQRVRLRAQALGIARPFSPRARRLLRAVGRASRARGRAYAASRRRRALRAGRRHAPLRCDGQRGLRRRELDEATVLAALRTEDAAAERLKSDARSRVTAVTCSGRRMIVKRFASGGPLRILANLLRGSPARRAWLGAHGLRAHRIGTATPLAFLEQRRLGAITASTVVLEDLRPAPAADRAPGAGVDPQDVVQALLRLLLRLHASDVDHRDLKASHVMLLPGKGHLAPHLIDLESVRFPRRLHERRRVAALAALNASLPDDVPDALRCQAFARYAALLPFREPAPSALRRIVEISLARRHRWSGAGCDVARRLRPADASAGIRWRP